MNNQAPELSPEARRLINEARGADDPTAEDQARVKARWLASVAAIAGVSSLTEAARAAGGIGWGFKAVGAALVIAAGAIGMTFLLDTDDNAQAAKTAPLPGWSGSSPGRLRDTPRALVEPNVGGSKEGAPYGEPYGEPSAPADPVAAEQGSSVPFDSRPSEAGEPAQPLIAGGSAPSAAAGEGNELGAVVQQPTLTPPAVSQPGLYQTGTDQPGIAETSASPSQAAQSQTAVRRGPARARPVARAIVARAGAPKGAEPSEQAPSVAPVPVAGAATLPGATPGAAAAGPSGQLSEELALLSDVRSSIQGGAAARAVELLDRYEARFGQPILGMEADALRVDALCKAGQREASRERARAFQKEWPGSPLEQRVSAACP